MDLFFKMHHVFEIKFDERLQNSMTFLMSFVYKMKGSSRKPTVKMIELHNRLMSIVLPVSSEVEIDPIA